MKITTSARAATTHFRMPDIPSKRASICILQFPFCNLHFPSLPVSAPWRLCVHPQPPIQPNTTLSPARLPAIVHGRRAATFATFHNMGILIKTLSEDGSYPEYLAYIQSIENKLPASAYEYAIAEWHYSLTDPRGIHDAWLQSLTITGVFGPDQRPQTCDIQATFLNAFCDRLLKFHYQGVISYNLQTPATFRAHPDVYFDEIRLSDRANVIHEILFMDNIRWIIESRNFSLTHQKLPALQTRP